MTHDTAGRVRPGCTYEVNEALRHSGKLSDLIDSGTLSPDGAAAAHGAAALFYAVLALRETIAAAASDTADAVTDLDATVGIIAGAVTDAAVDGAVLALAGAHEDHR